MVLKAQTKRETSSHEPAITKLNINKTQNRPKIWITNKMKRKPSTQAFILYGMKPKNKNWVKFTITV